jgi:glycosyltransferase involved in cell wall biosynthesis
MEVYIYILCYNEQTLIQNTITHYKQRFPKSVITIMDNCSTDNSVSIAKKNGCKIHSWTNGNDNKYICEYKYLDLKNNIWKNNKSGWSIVCDMDELLEIDEDQLLREENMGTTIISTQGINMVGESKYVDLKDINVSNLKNGYYDKNYSKNICFKNGKIREINYLAGCHECKPYGTIIYSKKKYFLKHLDLLGEQFLVNKIINRFKRKSQRSIKLRHATHYIDDVEAIKKRYQNALNKMVRNII